MIVEKGSFYFLLLRLTIYDSHLFQSALFLVKEFLCSTDIGIVPPPPPMMPMHGDIGAIRPASPPPIDNSYSYMAAGVPPPPAPISPNVQVPG